MKRVNLINGQKPEFGNLEHIKILQKEQQEIKEREENTQWRREIRTDPIMAMASLPYLIFCLNENWKSFDEQAKKQTPIDRMIDEAVGKDDDDAKKFLERVIPIFDDIIICHKCLDDPEGEKLHNNTRKELKKYLAKLNIKIKANKN